MIRLVPLQDIYTIYKLDLSLIGILSDIARPLKEGGISIFTVSTYKTDYIFVKEASFGEAAGLLDREKNMQVLSE